MRPANANKEYILIKFLSSSSLSLFASSTRVAMDLTSLSWPWIEKFDEDMVILHYPTTKSKRQSIDIQKGLRLALGNRGTAFGLSFTFSSSFNNLPPDDLCRVALRDLKKRISDKNIITDPGTAWPAKEPMMPSLWTAVLPSCPAWLSSPWPSLLNKDGGSIVWDGVSVLRLRWEISWKFHTPLSEFSVGQASTNWHITSSPKTIMVNDKLPVNSHKKSAVCPPLFYSNFNVV